MSYINKRTGREISTTDYYELDSWEQNNYERKSSGSFVTSVVIGAVTDSALLGGIISGSMTGGIIGDMLDGDLFD